MQNKAPKPTLIKIDDITHQEKSSKNLNQPEFINKNEWFIIRNRQGSAKRLFIVLQGYFHNKQTVTHWANDISNRTEINGDVLYATYDFYGLTFVESSRILSRKLKKMFPNGGDYNEIIFIGYSMGGIVARSIVNFGFPFDRLYTLCSPHHGMFNIPDFRLFGRGYDSLKWGSWDLYRLWSSRGDRNNRFKFYCIGYQYTIKNRKKTFEDDTAMWVKSASGNDFKEDIYKREIVTWDYGSHGFPILPTDKYAPHKLPTLPDFYNSTLQPILNNINHYYSSNI